MPRTICGHPWRFLSRPKQLGPKNLDVPWPTSCLPIRPAGSLGDCPRMRQWNSEVLWTRPADFAKLPPHFHGMPDVRGPMAKSDKPWIGCLLALVCVAAAARADERTPANPLVRFGRATRQFVTRSSEVFRPKSRENEAASQATSRSPFNWFRRAPQRTAYEFWSTERGNDIERR